MKSFKLYVYKSDVYRILITQQNNISPTTNSSLYSTFDEHIEFAENDQLTLTFSMMKYVDRVTHNHRNASTNNNNFIENQFYKLLQMGSKIELILDNKDKYSFIITGIKPNIGKNNIKFDYTCKDEASYSWSRRNLGMSYSTVERGGVRTIYQIAEEVFQLAGLHDWQAKPRENNEIEDELLSIRKITLEVEDSNPYNILIEACNALNAYMKVNYTHKYVSFYQKDKIKFSGYRYRPEVNLKSLDADYDMDEMSTIMHVYGGTDEYDQIVSLMPAVPSELVDWWKINHEIYKNQQINWKSVQALYPDSDEIKTFTDIADSNPALGNFLYDFEFFKNNKILSEEEYNDIHKILDIQMAYNNMWLKIYEPYYWRNYSMCYIAIQELKTALENEKAGSSKPTDEISDNLKSI